MISRWLSIWLLHLLHSLLSLCLSSSAHNAPCNVGALKRRNSLRHNQGWLSGGFLLATKCCLTACPSLHELRIVIFVIPAQFQLTRLMLLCQKLFGSSVPAFLFLLLSRCHCISSASVSMSLILAVVSFCPLCVCFCIALSSSFQLFFRQVFLLFFPPLHLPLILSALSAPLVFLQFFGSLFQIFLSVFHFCFCFFDSFLFYVRKTFASRSSDSPMCFCDVFLLLV